MVKDPLTGKEYTPKYDIPGSTKVEFKHYLYRDKVPFNLSNSEKTVAPVKEGNEVLLDNLEGGYEVFQAYLRAEGNWKGDIIIFSKGICLNDGRAFGFPKQVIKKRPEWEAIGWWWVKDWFGTDLDEVWQPGIYKIRADIHTPAGQGFAEWYFAVKVTDNKKVRSHIEVLVDADLKEGTPINYQLLANDTLLSAGSQTKKSFIFPDIIKGTYLVKAFVTGLDEKSSLIIHRPPLKSIATLKLKSNVEEPQPEPSLLDKLSDMFGITTPQLEFIFTKLGLKGSILEKLVKILVGLFTVEVEVPRPDGTTLKIPMLGLGGLSSLEGAIGKEPASKLLESLLKKSADEFIAIAKKSPDLLKDWISKLSEEDLVKLLNHLNMFKSGKIAKVEILRQTSDTVQEKLMKASLNNPEIIDNFQQEFAEIVNRLIKQPEYKSLYNKLVASVGRKQAIRTIISQEVKKILLEEEVLKQLAKTPEYESFFNELASKVGKERALFELRREITKPTTKLTDEAIKLVNSPRYAGIKNKLLQLLSEEEANKFIVNLEVNRLTTMTKKAEKLIYEPRYQKLVEKLNELLPKQKVEKIILDLETKRLTSPFFLRHMGKLKLLGGIGFLTTLTIWYLIDDVPFTKMEAIKLGLLPPEFGDKWEKISIDFSNEMKTLRNHIREHNAEGFRNSLRVIKTIFDRAQSALDDLKEAHPEYWVKLGSLAGGFDLINQGEEYEAQFNIMKEAFKSLSGIDPADLDDIDNLPLPFEDTTGKITLLIKATDIETGQPVKARVLLDGEPLIDQINGEPVFRTTEKPLILDPDKDYLIEVEKIGYKKTGMFLKTPPAGISPDNLSLIEGQDVPYNVLDKNLIELELVMTRETTTENKGDVAIFTEPEGATIEIDGFIYQFPTPRVIKDLDVGKHTLKLTKSGYEPIIDQIEVVAGEQTKYQYTLIPAPEKPTKGFITVKTDKNIPVKVFIDDLEQFGTTPLSAKLDPGQHIITIFHKDYVADPITVDLKAGENKVIVVPLHPKQQPETQPNAWKYTIRVLDPDTKDDLAFKIIVNNEFTGKFTPEAIYLSPEKTYILELSKSGYKTIQAVITTEPLPK